MQKYAEADIKLAALDMDGTLLNSDHETTPYTREVIHHAAEAGKIVALSTGRCLSELTEHFKSISDIRYAICENGACVYDAKEKTCIRQITISREDAEFVLDLADKYDVNRQMFINNQSYLECRNEEDFKRFYIYDFVNVFRIGSVYVDDMRALFLEYPENVEKINIYFTNEAEREAFCREMEGKDLLIAGSVGMGIEISPNGANKGEGLQALCDYLHLSMEQSMAVGDGGNDVDIMKVAGLAVAMGNAIEEVIELADVVTEDCDHDGAAKAIERYMLGKKI